jgi:mono/diheme cytochrome c family protein
MKAALVTTVRGGLVGGLLVGLLAACSPKGSYQAMASQPRYEAYEGSDTLPQGASVRPLVAGVVARGYLGDDTLLQTGLDEAGNPSEVFPFEVTRKTLARGQAQYNAICTPCHDYAGTGRGIAVERGFTPPPSFHSDRLREAPVGHLYAVITDGFGAMPSYAEQLKVRDRWAVVSYVRALQLSQHATLGEVPAAERSAIQPPATEAP